MWPARGPRAASPRNTSSPGPGWSGALPEGLTQVKSPTALVWICGRIYCTGTPEDYKAVHELQDQYRIRSAQRLRQALHAAARRGG